MRLFPSLRAAVVLCGLALAGILIEGGGLGAQTVVAPATRSTSQGAWPQTRPEASGFAETSRYDDVMSFMKAMAAASPQIHLTTYGYTPEGRPMPMAVIGAPGATPEQVLAT